MLKFALYQRSTFEKIIKASTKNFVFNNCQSKDININPVKENNCYVRQVMELKSDTIVDGAIVFQSNKGTIHMYDKAIIKGSVSGANVVCHE